MNITVNNFFKLVWIVLLFVTVSSQAQPAEKEELPITQLDLNAQYKRINDDSETFKEYKVIHRKMLADFWNRVMDSVDNYRGETDIINERAMALAKEIKEAKNTIESKNTLLLENDFEKQHIQVLGINFKKSAFINLSFISFFLALGVLAFFIYKFKESNSVTVKTKSNYDDLDQRFEQYKKEALDKQMKLRRDLQTESNKLHELQQKIGSLK